MQIHTLKLFHRPLLRKDIDRILHYDYYEQLTTQTINYNRTVTKLDCTEVDPMLNPNSDGW